MVIRAFVPGEMTQTMTTIDEERVDSIEARLTKFDGRLKETKKRIDGLYRSQQKLEEVSSRTERRLEELSKQLRELTKVVFADSEEWKVNSDWGLTEAAPATKRETGIATVEVQMAKPSTVNSTCYEDMLVGEVENCFGKGNRKFPGSSKAYSFFGAQNVLDEMPELIEEVGFTVTTKEKMGIPQKLTRLDIDIVQADLPASSDADFEAVKLMANEVEDVGSDHVMVICVLSMCNKRDIDKAWDEVSFIKKPMINMFNATNEIHMTFKLEMISEQVIENARSRMVDARRMGAFCDNVLLFPPDFSFASYQDLKFSKPVQDNVHISFYHDPIFLKFIDTGQFQRLRDLKQLWMAPMVYTGDIKSRFEHFLGVYWLVGKMVHKFKVQQRNELGIYRFDMQVVKLAGLLHNIGHGPHNHLFAREFLLKNIKASEWSHVQMFVESVDQYILDEQRIDINTEIVKQVKEMILANNKYATTKSSRVNQFLYDIVANDRNGIDDDKFGYTIRDRRACGLGCDFQFQRLMESMRVVGDKICYQAKDYLTIHKLFTTRVDLFKTIYTHGNDSSQYWKFDDTIVEIIKTAPDWKLKEFKGQHVILHMLGIPPAAEALNGVKMELVDAVFPLLKGVSVLKNSVLGIKYVQKVNFVGLPSIRAIDMGVRSLIQIGAITVKNDIYDLTAGGWEMVKLGIEPRICKIILECFCLCLGREGLVLAALMESYNIIFCRFSTLVNQLKSDCFKVQFCHPSDDPFTLLAFYKEWDDVPREKKNSWENRINPKSPRRCLDTTLLKLEAWLKSELNISLSNYWCWDSQIHTEHDKNLKNILLPLLVNYVSMYSGYDHLGYEVALTKKLVQLHPSCCLLNFGQKPDGMVFGVIISSSKEYLNHVGAGDRVLVDLPPLDEAGQVLLLPVKMLNRSIAKKINSVVGQMWCSRRAYHQRRRCEKMRPRCSSVFPTFSHEVMAVNGGWFVM